MSSAPIPGEFQRNESGFRNFISSAPNARFPPASGRYHLYVAHACPWAHRTMLTRALKGLEDVISVTIVHPVWQKTRPDDQHCGWAFSTSATNKTLHNSIGIGGPFPLAYKGTEPDPLFGARYVRDIYEACHDTRGVYSVPILVDKHTKTIVNNESSEIIRMLNSEFNEFARNPHLDLYSPADQAAIDAANDWIYPAINNGVYRCGFAKSQAAYDAAIQILADGLDKLESILKKQDYIAGDHMTEADVRLFPTLLRFDEVYVVYFKTNARMIAHTPALLEYCRRMYQQPGVANVCDMEQIKAHYYTSHPTYNHYSIIPRGSDFVALLEQK